MLVYTAIGDYIGIRAIPTTPHTTVFIRRALTRTGADGTRYYTFRLCQAKREGDRVRQRTLLNLGAHFKVDKKHWRYLCQRIETVLMGQLELWPDLSSHIEGEAQRIAALLAARGAEVIEPTDRNGAVADWRVVNANAIKTIRSRTVGVEHVGLWAMEQLKMPALFDRLQMTPSMRRAAIGSIIGRLAQPGSERATKHWLERNSGLDEFVGGSYEAMGPMHLYRASDLLVRHQQAIEQHLFTQALDLFAARPTVTLYDLTNTFLEGTGANIDKAKRGHSKERRRDCPLLTLALVLDGSGFVRKSKVFAGNVREHRTLEEMLAVLQAGPEALVVMDRGIATEDRIQWLHAQKYQYIVVARERRRVFDPEAAQTLTTAGGERLSLYRQVQDDQVRLYCYSASRAAKEQAIVARQTAAFEQALKKLSDGLSRPRTHKRLEVVSERLGRLKERYGGIGQHYDITVQPDESGKRAHTIEWEQRLLPGSMATHPGVYCLRSNLVNWTDEALWRTYIRLTDVEAVFRTLKSELGLRPIYHSTGLRAEGHLFISVIAYQLVQVIRTRLRSRGLSSSWTTLRSILQRQTRTTSVSPCRDGRTLHVRTTAQPDPELRSIYDALGIDYKPLSTKKTVV